MGQMVRAGAALNLLGVVLVTLVVLLWLPRVAGVGLAPGV